jgi:hypothetical protein
MRQRGGSLVSKRMGGTTPSPSLPQSSSRPTPERYRRAEAIQPPQVDQQQFRQGLARSSEDRHVVGQRLDRPAGMGSRAPLAYMG